MERLTDIEVVAGQVHPIPRLELQNPSGFEKIVSRLQEIEDILGDSYDLDRLRELVEADKQGRALIVTDEMATAMRAGALVLCRKGSKKLIGTGLNWTPREGKTLYIPYRKAADMLKEAAAAALAKETDHE